MGPGTRSSNQTAVESPALDSDTAALRRVVLDHWKLLDRLARRRFPDANLADEALLYVVRGLEAHDWRRVRAFEGKSSFAGFLSCVAVRLLEDFVRSKFGRPRAPRWVKSQGALWEEVFRLLCMERMSRAAVCEILAPPPDHGKGRAYVEEAIDIILARLPDCGNEVGEKATMAAEELENQPPPNLAAHYLTPEDFHIAWQRVSILEGLGRHLMAGDPPLRSSQEAGNIKQMILALDSCLALDAEERLFLKMIYQDGLTVSAAGRVLSWEPNQAHGRLRRLLARIRAALEKCGLDRDLKIVLDS